MEEEFNLFDAYHVPHSCEKCGGVMIFKGVGEYECEKCGAKAYDDYGKVRLFLEEHAGANAVEVEAATGVTQKSIRQMLRESRLQVADDSNGFLRCEMCHKPIRSGRFCQECEVKVHRTMEQRERLKHSGEFHGFGMGANSDEGRRRFRRDN